MALIVETGAGVVNADAYADMSFFDAYMSARGRVDWATADVLTEKEPAVRRGTRAIDILFADRWPGQRTNGRDQALAWPRTNVVTTEGDDLAANVIPIELQEATAEATWIEYGEAGVLLPTPVGQIEKSVTIGPISIDYADQPGRAGDLQLAVHIPLFERLLWNLLLPSTLRMRFLVRA